MPVTRRTVLQTLTAMGIGTIAGTSAYGFLYGRHDLELTLSTLPVAGLPPRLNGLRIGFITDVHRSEWVSHDDVIRAVALLMAQRPDLIVLGGDYVTWGNRQYVGAVAAQKFPVVAGVGRRNKTTMFVSRGVGTVFVPVRVNCPPEVAVLTLRSADN